MSHWHRNNWHVDYIPKPVPDRSHDFNWRHDDYDGAPDSKDNRCGTAGSEAEAWALIEEMERADD